MAVVMKSRGDVNAGNPEGSAEFDGKRGSAAASEQVDEPADSRRDGQEAAIPNGMELCFVSLLPIGLERTLFPLGLGVGRLRFRIKLRKKIAQFRFVEHRHEITWRTFLGLTGATVATKS